MCVIELKKHTRYDEVLYQPAHGSRNNMRSMYCTIHSEMSYCTDRENIVAVSI